MLTLKQLQSSNSGSLQWMQNFKLRTTAHWRFYHIKHSLHSHIPSCIRNYILTRVIITFGSQSCFGNYMATGRDVSSNAQHPSLVKPYAIIIVTAKKLVLHHLNAPVTASGLQAAKAIWCRVLNTLFIKEMLKRNTVLALNRDILLLNSEGSYNAGVFFGA